VLGWAGGAESGAVKDVRAALGRYREAFDVLGRYVLDRGYGIRVCVGAQAQ
jgi:xylose isomerase